MTQQMPRIVAKFGGSNLKSAADLHHIGDIIEAYQQPIVIVVSAFFGVTNFLQEMLWKCRTDEQTILAGADFLKNMKQELVNSVISDPILRAEAFEKIDFRLRQMTRYLLGVHYMGDAPSFAEDTVLSYGEQFSAAILSGLLKSRGLEAEELLPDTLGLITDGEFGNATVDFSASCQLVRKALSKHSFAVIPGFYGISPAGKINLFGRGGSDYSAAALARIIQAESLDVWKDVNGFMSADPKLVRNVRQIPEISYTEAAELAYFGAKILHPRTMEPLLDDSIPIRIFDSRKFRGSLKAASIVHEKREIHSTIIKSVTYSDDFGVLQLAGPGVGIKPGILAMLTRELDRRGINIKSVITAQTSINILLSLNDLELAADLTRRAAPELVKNITVQDDVALIAVVGEGILETPGLAAKVFGAVYEKRINVQIISMGASPVAAYFLVDQKDRTEAVRAIHHSFINNGVERV
ncbi:MAG TPA: aspartate kinase [Candidatus Marinimicrobia bacterium]|nr:aspartate kinase [Candidatus Neomarinimicrobiota bacterium]